MDTVGIRKKLGKLERKLKARLTEKPAEAKAPKKPVKEAAQSTVRKPERAIKKSEQAAKPTEVSPGGEELKTKSRKKLSPTALRNREQCITLAMECCGWSRAEAEANIERTRELTGITYDKYRRYRFFRIPEDEQLTRYQEIRQNQINRKQRNSESDREHIQVILEATGWTEEQFEEHFRASKQASGASLKDYYAFRFWEVPEEEQKTYFTHGCSYAIGKRYDVYDVNRDIMLNKELSCQTFQKYLGRPWCVNRDLTPEKLRSCFSGEEKIIYKPLDGNGGLGFQVFEVGEDCWERLTAELLQLPRGVAEGYIRQHPDMAAFTAASVNTLRIVSVSHNTVSGEPDPKAVDIAYAALRIGNGKASVDNFTVGGLVAGVDLETGTVSTEAANMNGESFARHPESGMIFKGSVIPFYQEALAMVREAAQTVSGYLGWDVAITENGPVLIEVNLQPGNRILQMPYVKEHRGMRDLMQKYLPEDQIKLLPKEPST